MFEGRNDHLRLNCNFSSGLEKKSFKEEEEEEEESCFYQSVCVCIDKILSQPFWKNRRRRFSSDYSLFRVPFDMSIGFAIKTFPDYQNNNCVRALCLYIVQERDGKTKLNQGANT